MTTKSLAISIETEILNALDALVESSSYVFVTDNLLSQFEFRRLSRAAEKITDLSSRFLVESLLALNYDRNLEAAENSFAKSISHDRYSLTAWTHFPAFLSQRGFVSTAYKYFKEAVEFMPCKGTLYNLHSAAVDARDSDTALMVANTFIKMYPAEEEYEDWVSSSIAFSRLTAEQNELLSIDHKLVTQVLLKVQDYIAESGYRVVNAAHHFEPYREEVFIVLRLAGLEVEDIGDMNGKIADFMVENDYFDCKLTLAVSM